MLQKTASVKSSNPNATFQKACGQVQDFRGAPTYGVRPFQVLLVAGPFETKRTVELQLQG